MDKLFLTILNMSLTGSFVIAAICLVRLPLKKAPKIISYCLWAVAGFRLLFPFSIESVFSLIPFNAQTIPPDIAMQPIPRINSGIPFVNNAVSSVLPAATPAASVNPLQIWTTIGAFVWLMGVAVMLIYSAVSFLILKQKMREAAHIEANTYEAKNITSPFVLGVFKPKIYLPVGLSAQERGYIILHEQTHIRRHDHIVKFTAYFILCLHWFNPLAWAAFLLMGVDMEMSCDEGVLKKMGSDAKKNYSLSLLSLATKGRIVGGSPLAFGEGGVKERIKNVLNFKKPSRVIITLAVALVAVLSVGFALNRATPPDPQNFSLGTYTLENMTEKQRMERMTSFTLHDDGTATFTMAPISSYIPPDCTYAVEDGEMVFRAVIKTDWDRGFFGLEDNAVVARFSVEDKNTLVFASAAISLFAEPKGRYVNAASHVSAVPDYEPQEWLNYFYNDKLPWDSSFDLELPEYPDTIFRWTPEKVTAIAQDDEKELFSGMPVWNVYLADLTRDGLPEFCATISIGSGIVDNRVVAYDYSAQKLYELSDRMNYDYALSLEDGHLIAGKTEYNTGTPLAAGDLAIVNNELIIADTIKVE